MILLTQPKSQWRKLIIHALFVEFKLEQNALNHCNDKFDHVIILDGGTVNAARIGLYCGTHHPFTVRSSGRDMFIQFRSDISHSLIVSSPTHISSILAEMLRDVRKLTVSIFFFQTIFSSYSIIPDLFGVG